jgi:hypothetical protein
MELIIVLAIVGIIIAFLVIQRRKDTAVVETPAVGQPFLPTEPVVEPVIEPVVEAAPVVATAEVTTPSVVDEVVTDKPAPKAKKPRKPKAVVADDSAVEAVKKPRKPRSKKV